VGADLLVNVDARAPDGRIRKSAVLVGATGSLGSYQKTRLVPFGEYVPLRPLFGWLTRNSKAAAEDRQPGSGPVVVHAGALPIGPLVSYEIVFPDLARRAAQLGAELLAYQSSTSSFQGSWAQPQLAAQPAVRAAETGRPAVHVGLSGDSSAFDARGRRLAWCPSTFRGVIVVSVPLESTVTPYQRLGDWVPVTSLVVLGGAVFRWRRAPRFDTLPG
jgi:apolipoprotein N-acyltransferase